MQEFWATCACPDKQSCTDIFCCMAYTSNIQNFWGTSACPEKQRVPWIYCIEYILFIIQEFWITCACPEKQSALEFFTVLNVRYTFTSFEQLSLALKNSCPEIFAVWYMPLHAEFLSSLYALALKNRVALIFFTVFEYVLLSFRFLSN